MQACNTRILINEILKNLCFNVKSTQPSDYKGKKVLVLLYVKFEYSISLMLMCIERIKKYTQPEHHTHSLFLVLCNHLVYGEAEFFGIVTTSKYR
ncbi:hypothetical protein S245_008078 [Arachis hypogaea]